MDLNKIKQSIIIMFFILSIIPILSVIINSVPIKQDPFVAIALLDENGKAKEYIPSNTNLTREDPININLYIQNNMERVIYTIIKIKIQDSDSKLPNSTSCIPSEAQTSYELRRILSNTEVWITPLSFKIINLDVQNENYLINTIMINEEIINLNVTVNKNLNPRLIFEIWVYDDNIKHFSFSWQGLSEIKCAWNQLFLNFE